MWHIHGGCALPLHEGCSAQHHRGAVIRMCERAEQRTQKNEGNMKRRAGQTMSAETMCACKREAGEDAHTRASTHLSIALAALPAGEKGFVASRPRCSGASFNTSPSLTVEHSSHVVSAAPCIVTCWCTRPCVRFLLVFHAALAYCCG